MSAKRTPENEVIDEAVQRVCSGDTAAFEVIVRRLERPLRAWLAVQALPGIDIDEVAQKSFIAAYMKLDNYEPGTNFAAWMYTIARFQLKTETTRVRRVADYHTRYGHDLLEKELQRRDAGQPLEVPETQLDRLHKCLNQLGEHLRRFIRWRYEEEIPLVEMAERSGRSIPAVKKQLWKLRRTLQMCIETQMSAEGEQS